MLTDSQMWFYFCCICGLHDHDYFVSRSYSQINRRRAQMLGYHVLWDVKRQMGEW